MNKFFKITLLTISLSIFMLIFTNFAQAENLDRVTIKINSIPLKDQGLIIAGRTYIAIDNLFLQKNPKIFWNDQNKNNKFINISSDLGTLNIYLDKNYSTFNNQKIFLSPKDSKEFLMKNNRTYIPLRSMAYILDYDLSWDSQNRQVNLFKNPKITISVREGSHLIMKNINKYRRDYPVKELIYCPLSKDIENVSNIDSLNKNYHIYCLVEKTGGLKPKDFFLVSKYNGSIYDWVNKDGSLRFSEINQ